MSSWPIFLEAVQLLQSHVTQSARLHQSNARQLIIQKYPWFTTGPSGLRILLSNLSSQNKPKLLSKRSMTATSVREQLLQLVEPAPYFRSVFANEKPQWLPAAGWQLCVCTCSLDQYWCVLKHHHQCRQCVNMLRIDMASERLALLMHLGFCYYVGMHITPKYDQYGQYDQYDSIWSTIQSIQHNMAKMAQYGCGCRYDQYCQYGFGVTNMA